MAIKDLPVWSFAPNWDTPLTESRQWLTDILASDDGSEQRRSLRFHPRRSFDFAAVAVAHERSLLDNMLVTYGSATWYVPEWHDVAILGADVAAGESALQASGFKYGGLVANAVAILINEDPFDFELIEIATATDPNITIQNPLTKAWDAGTRIMPVAEARLLDQPEQSKRSDEVTTFDVQFELVGKKSRITTLVSASSLSEQYGGFYVFPYDPNDDDNLSYSMERNLDTFDPEFGAPVWRDIAGRGFTTQEIAIQLHGTQEHLRFENMLNVMRGRAVPLWVPTFNRDFVVAADVTSGSSVLTVERSGFVFSGGPRDDRQHIMIETTTGRYFREIVDAGETATTETLVLDEPFGTGFAATDVIRICFITLMRLTSDTVEIEHHTDRLGVSDVKFTMRSAPDTRIPETAF